MDLNAIKKLGIKTVCTATGVKNLYHEALNYDISIYFESNGHGTVLFNKSYEELKELEEFYQKIETVKNNENQEINNNVEILD